MRPGIIPLAWCLGLAACTPQATLESSQVVMPSDSVSAFGIVNSIDSEEQRVNITHGPIPQLNWAPMKMDFEISPSVTMPANLVGRKIRFQMKVEQDSRYILTVYQLL